MRARGRFVALALPVALAVVRPGLAAAADGVPRPSPAPAGGQAVIASDWATLLLQRQSRRPEFGVAERSDAGLRLVTQKKPPGESNLETGATITTALTRGQPVLLRFAARSLKAAEMTGQTQLGVFFQKASPDWFKSLQTTVQPGDQWQRYDVPFKVLRDYRAGEASINFGFGFPPQVVEIADLELIAYPPGTELSALPRTQALAGDVSPAVYDAAVARIGQFRKMMAERERTSPVVANGRTLHVAANATGGDGSKDRPFGTIQAAIDQAGAGDTVLIAAGLYDAYDTKQNQVHTKITTRGRPDAWLRIHAAPGGRPKVVSPTWNALLIDGASYVEVRGLEFEGVLSPMSKNSGNGIHVKSRSTHVRLIDNVVHGFGGGGIASGQADYLHVEGNVVHHTSHGSDYGNSGISFYQCFNSDDAPGYHNVIRRNVSYANENTIPFRSGGGQITDGNGIIVDDNRNTQNKSTQGVYRAWTLIENNLVYGNGGRGIHCFLSDRVDIINNTIYQDQHSRDITNGELTAVKSDDVTAFNNVVVPRTNLRANTDERSKNVVFGHNVLFNTDDYLAGRDAIVGKDPMLRQPAIDAKDAEAFRPRAGSPLIGKALAAVAPADDLFGRQRQGKPDVGAIQGAAE